MPDHIKKLEEVKKNINSPNDKLIKKPNIKTSPIIKDEDYPNIIKSSL